MHFLNNVYLLGAPLAVIAGYKLLEWLLRPMSSPLRVLSAPCNTSWLSGNLKDSQRLGVEPYELLNKWSNEIGHTFTFKGFLSVRPDFSPSLSSDKHASSATISTRSTPAPSPTSPHTPWTMRRPQRAASS